MSDQGYTPTTEEVQRGYRRPPSARDGQLPGELFSDFLSRVSIRTALQEVADRVAFDRWLTEVRREAAEEAFDHALTCLRYPDGEPVEVLSVLNPYRKEATDD